MSYINRTDLIGWRRRFKSLPPRIRRLRRIGMSPYNPTLNRIRRGRIQATMPRVTNSIPTDHLLQSYYQHFYNFFHFIIQFKAKNYSHLTGIGPSEGMTWKQFAIDEAEAIPAGAATGAIRGAILSAPEAGIAALPGAAIGAAVSGGVTAFKDGLEYLREKYK